MTPDLDQPATRRDLLDLATKAELLETKGELQQAIAAAVAPLATRAELQETKSELHEAIAAAVAPLATKAELADGLTSVMQAILTVQSEVRGVQSEVRGMREELRISLGITEEEWARRVGVLEEKYQDLPARVEALERDLGEHKTDRRAHVPPPKPARRR